MPSRRAEPIGTAQSLVQVFDLRDFRGADALDDELGDTVAFIDWIVCTSASHPVREYEMKQTFEVFVRQVEE